MSSKTTSGSGMSKKTAGLLTLIPILISVTTVAVTEDQGFETFDAESEVRDEGVLTQFCAYFIDIGKGDSILLKGEQMILIDGGDFVKTNPPKILSIIERTGTELEDLDTIVLTHPDQDHYGGLLLLLGDDENMGALEFAERYDGDPIRDVGPRLQKFKDLWSDSNFEYDNEVLWRDKKIISISDNVLMETLFPIKDEHIQKSELIKINEIYEDYPDEFELAQEKGLNNINNKGTAHNANSLVFRISYDQFSILLAGDAESTTEYMLTEYYEDGLKSDVVKISHHGGAYSSIPQFVEATSPIIAIASTDEKKNTHHHPSEWALESYENQGSNVYRTDLDGTIEICSDGKSFLVETDGSRYNDGYEDSHMFVILNDEQFQGINFTLESPDEFDRLMQIKQISYDEENKTILIEFNESDFEGSITYTIPKTLFNSVQVIGAEGVVGSEISHNGDEISIVVEHGPGDDTTTITGISPITEELDENDIRDYFDGIRGDKQKLEEFFSDMPKGGDLHNHLSGSTDTEDLIQIARDKNFCIDESIMKLNGQSPDCPSGTVPIENVSSEDLLKSWSMYEFDSSSESGHDHFFDTFGKFGALSEYKSQMLGYWMITAEKQNMLYMETMQNDDYASEQVNSLVQKINDTNVTEENFDVLYQTIETDIEEIASVSADNIVTLDQQSRDFCKEKSNFECDIEFRYLSQIHRTKEIHNVFVQAALYFEIASQSEQVVGVNIVSAEDNKTSMNDYDLHMKIINFLHEKYSDKVNITLHAGELSTALNGSDTTVDITPSIMENQTHILLALDTGAVRIGHGVDSPYEIKTYPELYSMMSDNLTAIEIPLTSNKVILEVEGEDHPIVEYMNNDVPVVLSTDDPGILRTNMTHEYVFAAYTYPEFSYDDFKQINRNTLEFSFLSGKSLWPELGIYEDPLPQCNDDITTNCWTEGIDQKATIQFMLEEKLKEFESTR